MAETLSVLECPKPSIQGPHFNFIQKVVRMGLISHCVEVDRLRLGQLTLNFL